MGRRDPDGADLLLTANTTKVASMNGYTAPAAALWLASLIAGVIADAAEPVFIFVGGGSTLGATLFCTFAFSFDDDPDYGQATGRGVVIGGLFGAVLLLADALLGV